jgi:hypothetical protein
VGCSGLSTGIGSHTVQIKNGSTVLATVTTDVNGNYSGTSTSAIPSFVTVVITPSNPVFATTTASSTYNATTHVIGSVTVQPATGYHCGCCAIPWPATLHTSAGFDLTWTASPPSGIPLPTGTTGWFGCMYSGGPYPFAILNRGGTGTACQAYFNFYGHCSADLTQCIQDATPNCAGSALGGTQTTGLTIVCNPLVITFTYDNPLDHSNNWYCSGCPPSVSGYAVPWGPTITITP